MNGIEELWLSEAFSALEGHKMMAEYEQQLLYERLIEEEPLPEDPEKCGQYLDFLGASEEESIVEDDLIWE